MTQSAPLLARTSGIATRLSLARPAATMTDSGSCSQAKWIVVGQAAAGSAQPVIDRFVAGRFALLVGMGFRPRTPPRPTSTSSSTDRSGNQATRAGESH